MKMYSIYAAIPGKEKVFFNSYTNEEQAWRDKFCLKEIGLEVEMKTTVIP